jgi:hypothetical protein
MFMLLPCLHRFHNECVGEWFKRKNTCPNCKDNVSEHFRREDHGTGGSAGKGRSPNFVDELLGGGGGLISRINSNP